MGEGGRGGSDEDAVDAIDQSTSHGRRGIHAAADTTTAPRACSWPPTRIFFRFQRRLQRPRLYAYRVPLATVTAREQ